MLIKYIHCGDLHLGCKPNQLEQRYDDFFKSFDDLVDEAIKNACQYILIAGDLFHLKVINSKTLSKTITILDKAKVNHIKVIAIEGNHDKAFYVDEKSWLEFLDEQKYLILLKHEIKDNKLILNQQSIYEDENLRIIGIGYLGSTTQLYMNGLSIDKKDKYTVLMMHAAVNRLYGEEMGDIKLETLKMFNETINYLALGHIHVRYEYQNYIYNPGSLENIRLKDNIQGKDKGFFLVSFDTNSYMNKTVQYITSQKRLITNIKLEITDNMTYDDTIQYLHNYDYNLEEQSLLELTLFGKTKFNPYIINIDDVKNYIMNKYHLMYVEINNYINIFTDNKAVKDIVDIASIEEITIKKYIETNYPTDNIDDLYKDIKNLKKRLINEEDINEIISKAIDKREEI